ncbi:MAG TPA: prolipoprotein diacylglyceryl transferase [Streptosporangiaceae bacterium]|nr:prolipoprotein diacylglyceryl transferase [Streptosporangiaceae bacterium]
MSVAFLPSPAPGAWNLGPVSIRGYALCITIGIVVAVCVANRRYLRIGGRPGVILDVATWAVPFGLVGARVYSVLTDYELYFTRGRDWIDIFRIWDGGIGIPGALAAGTVGALIGCRRAGVKFGPVAGVGAPAAAFGQAIGRWGNWFNQELYGRPSSLPWAVEIDPAHRIVPYENYATFQPTFLYESIWDLAVGIAVIWAARRFLLTGDRTLALYVASYAVGSFAIGSLRIDFAHHILGLRVDQWVMLAAFIGAVSYLLMTSGTPGPDVITPQGAGSPAVPPEFAADATRADLKDESREADVPSESGVSRTARSGDDCTGGVISV